MHSKEIKYWHIVTNHPRTTSLYDLIVIATPFHKGLMICGRNLRRYSSKFLSSIQICLYGRHVFMGYLYDKEKTIGSFSNNNTETVDTWIDSDGWLHSGDIGRIEVGINCSNQ